MGGTMLRHLLVALLGLALLAPGCDGDDAAVAKKKRLRPFINNFPYAFSRVGKLRRLERVTITLTVDDGETEAGDPDHGQLSLALDGIDTGILLDGFPDGELTLTRGGVPDNAPQILAALRTDGELEASIIDHTLILDNLLTIPSDFDTTLTLRGKQRAKMR
jgi:hypothetical protein